MIFLLEVLGLIVKRVEHRVKILNNLKRVFKHGYTLPFLEYDQAITPLVKRAHDLFIKNHLREFLQNSVYGESNLMRDVCYLNFRIRLDDFA